MFDKLRLKILNQIRSPVEQKKPDYLFMQGFQNTAIRYFKYFNDGHGVTSSIENMVTKIAAIYFFLKLGNIWLAGVAAVIWTVITMIVGWYQNHYMAKVLEEINLKTASHYGQKSYQAGQDTPAILAEIRDLLAGKKEEDITQ